MINLNQSPFFSGTIQNFVKQAELKLKVEQRKQNATLPQSDEVRMEHQRQIDQISEDLKAFQEDNKLSAIDAKLRAGDELTDDELEYLKQKNPDLYQKAIEIKQERKEYKKELEQCKTKDEVEELQSRKMQQFMVEIKAIKKTPNISEEKKKELLEQISRRIMGIYKEYTKFVNSDEYKKLPKEEVEQGDKKHPTVHSEKQVESEVTFEAIKAQIKMATYETNAFLEQEKQSPRSKRLNSINIKA